MASILIASHNPGKIAEFRALLAPITCIEPQTHAISAPAETGLSFIENAILKARHASRIGNMPAIADDSGLVVPALQGQPGIYSARFAGEHATAAENNRLLLDKMKELAESERLAFFYCAIAYVGYADDPMPIIATGQWQGSITDSPQGAHGFGYDPIFYVATHDCTAAELPIEVKNTLSHRRQAMDTLKTALERFPDLRDR